MRDRSKPYYRKLGKGGRNQSFCSIGEHTPSGLPSCGLTWRLVDDVYISPSDEEYTAATACQMTNRESAMIKQVEHYEENARLCLTEAGMLAETMDSLTAKGLELTPEWHAAHVLYYADLCKKHIHENCAALEAAMGLQYHTDHTLISEYEHATSVGVRQLKAVGSTRYTPAKKLKWESIRNDCLKKKPRSSARAIARIIADETGDDFESIRAHFKS